jgi:murein DD-endopeptidase MepM/ murein hydrolase activator NlpD
MMHEPIQGFKPQAYPKGDVTQFFGENPSLYEGCCNMEGHNGLDIVRSYGTPIMCVEKGKVVEVKNDPNGYGRHIRVLAPENEWVYGHLSQIKVLQGDLVDAGQIIGLMGNSGFVVSGNTPYWKINPYAGTHLHLGRRPCKPYNGSGAWDLSYPTGDKALMTAPYQNGYYGSVDPLPLFTEGSKYLFTSNLFLGMKTDAVRQLQLRLNVTPTGFFGPLTFAAVKSYQGQNGLPSTGFCGPLTRAKLNE